MKRLVNLNLTNTTADGTYGFLRNTTITVPLKYLSNFRRPLKMILNYSKVESKVRKTKYCLLLVLGVANSVALYVLFLLSKTENYIFLSSLYQQMITINFQSFLSKDLKDQSVLIISFVVIQTIWRNKEANNRTRWTLYTQMVVGLWLSQKSW